MVDKMFLIGNKYEVVEKIGGGVFGDVFIVRSTSPSQERYVLKALEDVKISEDLKKTCLFLGENSQFLVKFFEIFSQKGKLMILMEYCSDGNLAKKINQEHPPSDTDIYRFIYESGMGLKTLHKANIVHCNIKPSNFFIGKDGSVKLGDYLMAPVLEALLGKVNFTENGYMAPEIKNTFPLTQLAHDAETTSLSVQRITSKVCTSKVDIFSLGVTLMEFILGHNPFNNSWGSMDKKLALTGIPVDFAFTHPHPAIQLARRMINMDASVRPTIDDVLAFSLPLAPLHTLCVPALEVRKWREWLIEWTDKRERKLATAMEAAARAMEAAALEETAMAAGKAITAAAKLLEAALNENLTLMKREAYALELLNGSANKLLRERESMLDELRALKKK